MLITQKNINSYVWSFTRSDETTVCIDRRFLTDKDRILFIDDFLADGHASGSVIDLCRQINDDNTMVVE